MKKKTDFKTKFNAVVLAFMLITLGSVVVYAVTRTITDSNDSITTYIRCSNGNMYDASAANLQIAIGVGGVIDIPLGTILITTPLLANVDNVKLRGQGEGTVLKLDTNSNCNIINVTKKNIVIENIKFDMNEANNGYGQYNAIDFQVGSWNCTVRGCSFYNGIWHLINTDSAGTQGRHTIENNYFNGKEHNGYGGAVCMRGSKNIIRNNYIKDTYANGICLEGSSTITVDNLIDGNIIWGEIAVGIYLEGSQCDNTTVVNNIVSCTGSLAYAPTTNMNVSILLSGNVTCSHNTCKYPNSHGIFYPNSGGSACRVTISDNDIFGVVRYDGIKIEDNGGTGYYIITGNHFKNIKYMGIYCDGEDVTISDNDFYNIDEDAICLSATVERAFIHDNNIYDCNDEGIEINNGICTIHDNIIRTVGGYGILLTNAEYCNIHDNIIIDTSMANAGIQFTNSVSSRAIGNYISGFATGIDEGGTSNYNIIIGNDCLGNTAPIDINGANTVNSTNLGAIS